VLLILGDNYIFNMVILCKKKCLRVLVRKGCRMEVCLKNITIYLFFPVCEKNKDILFMIESTSRIGPAGFNRVKTLMKQIVNAFDISETTTRISLMTVTSRPRVDLR